VVSSAVHRAGVQLLGNTRHPSIGADYEPTFRVLKELRSISFWRSTRTRFDMEKNVGRMDAGGNPFVDPQGYKTFVEAAERSFQAQLQRERDGRTERFQ
jgi:metallo-beta-lactamase class B